MTVVDLNIPAGVPSNGMVRVDWAPEGTFADPSAPTATELNAGTVQHLTCHVFPVAPSGTVTRKEKRRMCSVQAYEILGANSYSIDDIQYVYDIQNPSDETHAAYAALTPGTEGHLVFRWGMEVGPVYAAAQVIDLFPARLGPQNKMPPEPDDELMVSQPVSFIGDVLTDIDVAGA